MGTQLVANELEEDLAMFRLDMMNWKKSNLAFITESITQETVNLDLVLEHPTTTKSHAFGLPKELLLPSPFSIWLSCSSTPQNGSQDL